MFRCLIQFYGLPEAITLHGVEVDLEEGASIKEVLATLEQKVPALEGKVIRKGRLESPYRFNINGRYYGEGTDFSLHAGDRISLLVRLLSGG